MKCTEPIWKPMTYVCDVCGKTITNDCRRCNPHPIKEDGICCVDCYTQVVLPEKNK